MGCGRKIGPFDCCSVVCGDCLELMKQLPTLVCECGADVSGEGGIFHAVGGHKNRYAIDAIITDPPFNVRHEKWDVFTDEQFREFTEGWLVSAYRVAPLIASFFPDKFVPLLRAAADRNNVPYRRALVWHKPPGSQYAGASLDGYWFDFELIQVFGTPVEPRREVSDFGVMSHRTVIGQGHGCQKPIELLQRLVEGYVPQDGTTLDPFTGTGTTLVAAKKLGRHFLGFEISPEYCEIARDRLARIDAQPSLFAPKPEQMELGGGQ